MKLSRAWDRLRRYLITGVVVIAPVVVTAYVLVWLFRRLDAFLGGYARELAGAEVPGLGVAALVLILLLVGWVSHRTLGRRALYGWNNVLTRVPVVRRVYGAASQVVQSVLDRDEKLFQACALMEYPSEGSYSLVFVTARAPREMEDHVGTEMVTVFLPTFPNPTTGYLLVVPIGRLTRLEMTVEEGFRMVVSAGAALPEDQGGRRGGLDLDRLLAREGEVDEATPAESSGVSAGGTGEGGP